MGQVRITVDAHALIWYTDVKSNRYLSSRAMDAITSAEREGIIYVPIIVLLEILSVIEKGRYPLDFDALLLDIERNTSYQIVPFDTDLLKMAMRLPGLELHDRVIAATAMLTNSVLVSRDREIRASGVPVVW